MAVTTWFTSDHHFGHARILEFMPERPWNNIDEMNEGLIEKWNVVVKPADTVFHLGDLALGNRRLVLGNLKGRLNGVKFLIPGNHDYVWPHSKRKVRPAHEAMYADAGFFPLSINVFCAFDFFSTVLLSHLPYVDAGNDTERSGLEDRELAYNEFRPPNLGFMHLCGHVHGAWRTKGREFNVGVDVNNYTPVSEDEVREVFGVPCKP